jgi:iron complex outermembrane recepter protein
MCRPGISFCAFLISGLLSSSTVVRATQGQEAKPPQDLKKLSIEELSQVDVTSVSRRTERLSNVAAAVSVVRREDVMRAGATILAEAMRLGDAIDVARVNGNTWAVSARGFNISTANKLLVLVDGRSTYSPLFGGTFWDAQDTLLADLDRIEVIRGPGGSIWGAHAVNGVINIISRPAQETQGDFVTLIAGSDELPIVSARHGGRIGSGHYRVYGKYRRRGAQVTASGENSEDEIQFGQGGFRFDSDPEQRDRWFLSGAGYRGRLGLADREDGTIVGGHILGRWTRTTGSGQLQLQAYFDHTARTIPLQFDETRNAGDIDAQHELRTRRHTMVGGGQVHLSRGTDLGSAGFVFEPPTRSHWIATGFVQDEFEVARDRLYVIGGAKVGANNYTGADVQPTVRVRYQASRRQMAWAAISRAVRLPTRFDTELRLRNPATGVVTLAGTEDFDSESVIAYEAGYRARPHARVSADLAVFFNRYDSLRSQELRFVPTPQVFLENWLNAKTGGIEVAARTQVTGTWQLHGSYAWLDKSLSFDPGSTDPTGGVFEANDPAHLASLRSQLELPRGFAVDAFLRYVGRRPAPEVPGYAELDLRAGWRLRQGWQLSLVGQNLLHDHHQEFNFTPVIEFRRGVFLRSIWDF